MENKSHALHIVSYQSFIRTQSIIFAECCNVIRNGQIWSGGVKEARPYQSTLNRSGGNSSKQQIWFSQRIITISFCESHAKEGLKKSKSINGVS